MKELIYAIAYGGFPIILAMYVKPNCLVNELIWLGVIITMAVGGHFVNVWYDKKHPDSGYINVWF